ncbi:MAG: adenylate/guanylate cyclase domain-containing protein [Spirochaetaceae bacterium]|jgi:adenylate cyclase|nr:adenylate/guanylate cyclase domain-containing protein [Spirochaetaceae bacterium]
MKRNSGGVKKRFAALFMVLSVGALIFAAHFAGLFEYWEYKTYDFRVRLFAEAAAPSEDIILVLLDQASIDWAQKERGWSWPWPRRAYAEFVDYMNLAGAGSVTFDVIFSEPSVYGPGDDAEFVRASADFGRVVQTVFFSSQTGNTFSWLPNADVPLLEPEGFGPLLEKYRLSAGDVSGGQIGAQFPIPGLRETAGAMGNITGIHDSDNTLRRGSLFYLFDGKAVPGLSAASILVRGGDRRIVYDREKQALRWGAYTIPVDREGKSLLNFRGNLGRYIPYSAGEILQSAGALKQGQPPLLPPEDFAGKYVFFGYYAPGLFDIFNTPISSVYPGVGMHITMLDNILRQDFIRESPLWGDLLFIALPLILIILITLFTSRIPLAVGSAFVVFILIIGLGAGAYYALNMKVPLAAPLTGILTAFLASVIYNYATEGSQKRFIKTAFSQYLSPTVIDQLLANPERLSLGGERREISIFFSDVQGFTTISEKLDPSKLTELLNDYLSFMTDTILDSGGTIDKYEGDAIIAFWNAPVDYDDHAARALEASMLCQEKLEKRQEFFNEKYGCRLLTRIGLNTGYAVVGNMGSAKRFDYTMLGDSVNLAARLEGLNKQFGTYLMCTEATFNQAVRARPFFGRKLAQVAVVGKKEAVVVFEPMPERVFQGKADILKKFDAARDRFYQGDFAGALPRFEALAETDKPSFFYAEQCRYYRDHPAEWKGHWQAMSK